MPGVLSVVEPGPSSPLPQAPQSRERYIPTPSPLPRVMPHEQSVAEMIVYEDFKAACGKYPPHIGGYYVCVRIHQRDPEKKLINAEGKEVTLFRHTGITMMEDKYQSCVGLVIGMGPQAYQGTNFDGTPRFDKEWCRVGDFVIIPRYEGIQISYGDGKRGQGNMIPLMILPDDKIYGIVEDPEDIVATHVIDRPGGGGF